MVAQVTVSCCAWWYGCPRLLVDLLVMHLAIEGPGNSGDANLAFVFAPSSLLAFPNHNHLMFDGVPLLLATVPLLLSSFRSVGWLLCAIEEEFCNFIFAQLHCTFGNTEDACEQWFQRFDIPPNVAVIDVEKESQEGMGDVGAVVEEEHE